MNPAQQTGTGAGTVAAGVLGAFATIELNEVNTVAAFVLVLVSIAAAIPLAITRWKRFLNKTKTPPDDDL